MDNKHVIASSLTDNELARAFSELVAERWDNWDLSPFMVYLVDICSPNVLPYLAEQFDVDGLRGFEVAGNEQQQRDLIKRSIALHKFIGTPWAIREACRTVGFPIVILEEGVTAIPGGATSPEDWARFRILIEADEFRHITEDEARKLRLFVEFYKNERSHLVELGFFQTLVEDKLFRPEIEDRDVLATCWLSLNPRSVTLNPNGDEVIVEASASDEWLIPQTSIDWGDGSGDKLNVEYSGAAGASQIKLTSDPNAAGDRKLLIDIRTTGGVKIGTLEVKQVLNWASYSHDYSDDYPKPPHKSANSYSDDYNDDYDKVYNTSKDAFIELDTTDIFFSKSPDQPQKLGISSNTNWNIE